jgi:bifunctional DNase/RNase
MGLVGGWRASAGAVVVLLAVAGCTSTSPVSGAYSMRIDGVRVDPRTSSPVILLKEESGLRRRLPIWIGMYEAQSIALGMEEVETPRPNTHDLIQNILGGIRGELERVVITELRGNTYYAVLELEVDGSKVVVDSRPSDAIAVAVRVGAPVFATEAVLEAAGRRADDEPAVEIEWPVTEGGDDPARRH